MDQRWYLARTVGEVKVKKVQGGNLDPNLPSLNVVVKSQAQP
jgi:hypothetical protein